MIYYNSNAHAVARAMLARALWVQGFTDGRAPGVITGGRGFDSPGYSRRALPKIGSSALCHFPARRRVPGQDAKVRFINPPSSPRKIRSTSGKWCRIGKSMQHNSMGGNRFPRNGMSDLTHVPRRSFVTKVIGEPPFVRNETGTKQEGGGKRTRRRSVRVSILIP